MKPADFPNHEAQRDRGRAPLILAFAVVVALLAVWFWPRHPAVKAATAVPVNSGHPVSRDFPIRVAAVGTVQALNTVDVKVRVDGQLQRVAFNEGQDVKAGQLLAQLDQGPLTAQLHQAEAAQRKDQASLDNARLDLARYSKLVNIGAATTQAVDTAKAQVEALAATVAADAALVQSDRLQLSFTTLAAPFTGRVGAREADIGAIVHPADTTGIVTVTQMEPITVLFSVPQDVLPELLANQAKAPLAVSVTTRSGSTPLADGRLVFIDSTVDPTTGQIRLKASFTNQDRKLWPGELVNARVLVRTDMQRLAVPSRAVVNSQNGTQLYVIAANGTAQMRPVQTGVIVDGMTEIRSGIAPTDLVVFDGQSRLNPGVQVAATTIPASAKAPPNANVAGSQTDQDNPS
ncbi:efflux RND transporter periplasmic adaptor subunit [Paraburkholderia rhynchosiae]|uniref:Efflux RND transporter periplasmic adaptor subunit n=1 Tax=Paraburkholderia rhynchosiae TaxID=487049 RepID=A0A2N7WDH0_9BURK|nr:efflux RND transporter periplasmic adaptor subunit [Paraburkholderia rhynchosiae]PMS27424.1 efflux RND transporter periplasmic adaptor subunit [Paraburkholderia rhynchosiae]CAB3724733.1 Multidrug resistance protein MdtA [Paraburkholderia rhynchosiae]